MTTSQATVGFSLLAVTSVIASVAWRGLTIERSANPVTEARGASVESPIDALADCIQTRFHTLEGFGMARMPVVPQHVFEFDPQTSAEKASVSRLRDDGWDVAFYLGSRGLLKPKPGEAEWENAGQHSPRRAISKPLFVTDPKGLGDLPHPRELWDEGRKTIAGTAAATPVPAPIGRWSVMASPIRADREACLECHRAGGAGHFDGADTEPLRTGDPLGVAVFVYSRSRN